MLPIQTIASLKSKHSYFLIFFISISVFCSCVKDHLEQPLQPPYLQDESFFKRNDSLASFNHLLNGSNADDDFVNKMISQFKEVDNQHRIVQTIKKYHGYPAWDLSVILKDAGGLQTLVTPLKHADSDSTEALLFSIVQSGSKTKFIIADNKKPQTKLKEYGNKEATQFTLSSFKGLFAASNESYKRVKNYHPGQATANFTIITWLCWNYAYIYWDGPVMHAVATEWQCSSSITETGNNGGVNGNGIIDIECPAPDGGGGESWYYQTVTSPNQAIIDSLNGYPCAQSVLAAMPNLNTTVTNLLQNTFGTNPKVNIKYSVDPTLTGTVTEGYTASPFQLLPDGTVNITVMMNPDILANGSKEYMFVTYLHEGLHAYMDYEWHLFQLSHDTTQFRNQFPIYWDVRRTNGINASELAQHMQMSETYIGGIVNALQAYNPNVNNQTARQMAWNGLQGTTAWYLGGIDTSAVKFTSAAARNTTTNQYLNLNLTKCP